MRSYALTGALCFAGLFCGVAVLSARQTPPLTAVPAQEGDFVVHDFKFSDGQSLPEVRLHYTTIGMPQRDRNGRVTNAVLILHGTNRAGRVFLVPSFAGVLFGPSQLLDASKYTSFFPTNSAPAWENLRSRATTAREVSALRLLGHGPRIANLAVPGLTGESPAPVRRRFDGLHGRLDVGRNVS